MPAPPPPVPETLEELNARIDLVELRVVRRDMEFRHHAMSLKSRGRDLASPRRWVRPLAGLAGGGAGWLFWRLLRRRPHHRHARRDRHAGDARDARGASGGLFRGLFGGLMGTVIGAMAPGDGAGHGRNASGRQTPEAHAHATKDTKGHKPELALLQMMTMAWSFMPQRIRNTFGPETTQLLLGVVAGVVHGVQRKRKEQKDPGEAAMNEARHAGASVRAGTAAAPAPHAPRTPPARP